MRRTFVLVVFTALALALPVLAGCLGGNPSTTTPASTSPTTTTPASGTSGSVPANAQSFMENAFGNLTPDSGLVKMGMDLKFVGANASQAMNITVYVDTAANETLFTITTPHTTSTGSPSPFPGANGGTFTIFASHGATAILTGANATLLYDANATMHAKDKPIFEHGAASQGGLDPLAGIFGPANDPKNLTVTSGPTPATVDGKPAWKVTFKSTNPSRPGTGELYIYATEPMRPAKMTFDAQGSGESGPFSKGHLEITFHFGDDIVVPATDAMRRAAALAWTAKPGSDGRNETFVFAGVASLRIPLADLEFRVLDESRYAQFSGQHAGGIRFKLPLASGHGEDANFSVTYNDADKDGKVSAGDTLVVTVKDRNSSAALLTMGIYDAKTGTFATPFDGFVPLAMVALWVALVVSRRARVR